MEAQFNVPLGRFTTLKIGGCAKHFYQPTTVDELVEVVAKLQQTSEPFYVLGGGSNLLVSSEGVDGSVIRTAQLINISSPEQDVLDADAGVVIDHPLHRRVADSIEWTAQPQAESSRAAAKPPCTVPMGL